MSKKLLSLIRRGAVHVAPNTKVLKSEDLSTLVDAAEVLRLVQEDAKQYRVEVTKQLEKEKEQARQEGFMAGMLQWTDQIGRLEAEIKHVHAELKKLLTPITLKAAQKIVGREIQLSEDAIVDIIANVLKAVSQHQIITVYVNPADLELLEDNRDRLRQVFDRLESLSIQPRGDVEPGGCVVETEAGIINAEIENQWKRLEQAIEGLFKDIPEEETT